MSTTTAPSTPDSTTGSALAKIIGDVSKIDPDTMRTVASQLKERSEAFKKLADRNMEIHDAAKTEAGAQTNGNIPPVYKDTLDALEGAGTKFKTELTKIATSLEKDANGLLWIVENRQKIEDEAAAALKAATTKV